MKGSGLEELKKVGGILRSDSPGPSPRSHRVHFQPPSNLSDILSKDSKDELQGFMTHAQNLHGPALISWIEELQENIPLLNEHVEGFVQALFKVSWASQEASVAEAFKNFLINLLSAHSCYIRDIVNSLVSNFLLPEEVVHSHSHEVLRLVLLTCPLNGRRTLVAALQRNMPYLLTPSFETHNVYLKNLLKTTQYAKDLSLEILQLLVQRAVELDVRTPKAALPDDDEEEDDLFDFDDSVSTVSSATAAENALARARVNMENVMLLILRHIDETAADEDAGKGLYRDFLSIFESIILPTWATEHVQFTLFYFASKDPLYALNFLSCLWKKFVNPNTPGIVRQTSVTYIASLISRGRFVPLSVAKSYLEKIVLWIHSYIKNSDFGNKDFLFSDIKSHGPFYASVQSSLYMFAFRHEEFVNSKKNIEFLKSLNFNTIVTCPLNPLRVCLPPVVKNFASISRNYQLAYCDTIIQRNNRINIPVVGSLSEVKSSAKPILLDSFFPFDPYSLKESSSFIEPIYRSYTAPANDSESEEEDEIQQQEEEMEVGSFREIPSFGYGTSPGFKMI